MQVFIPTEVARHATNKYLGVLVAAKYARVLNEFPRDRSAPDEKKRPRRSAPPHGVVSARPFSGSRILLGVTGGIASYKSVWLARLLTQAGAEVDVVMTRAARAFVGAITFEAVTGRPVFSEIFGPGNALDHISLARAAAVIVVAPATADFILRAPPGP